MLEKTRLATLSSSTQNVSKLLRHFPNSAVVIHLLLNFFDLLGYEARNRVDFTGLSDSFDVLSFLFVTANWREVVLFVQVNLLLLLRHVLEVNVWPRLSDSRTAQFYLFFVINNQLSVSAEDAF